MALEIFDKFIQKEFSSLTKYEKIVILEEIERAISKSQKRDPVKIEIIDFERQETRGIASSNVIYLSENLFSKETIGIDLLFVYLHESRHIWQHRIFELYNSEIDLPFLSKNFGVSTKFLTNLIENLDRSPLYKDDFNYISPVKDFDKYQLQFSEIDADEYASRFLRGLYLKNERMQQDPEIKKRIKIFDYKTLKKRVLSEKEQKVVNSFFKEMKERSVRYHEERKILRSLSLTLNDNEKNKIVTNLKIKNMEARKVYVSKTHENVYETMQSLKELALFYEARGRK